MEIQEYIDGITDAARKNAIISAFDSVFECLEAHRVRNNLDDSELNIRVFEDEVIQAFASEDFNSIQFSTGLIEHYEKTVFPELSMLLPGAPAVLGANWVVDLGLAWSLSHEYVHIIRKHDSAQKSIGEAKALDVSKIPQRKRAALNLSQEELDKAFEHDADLCAIAGIYRYIQRRFRGFLDDMVIRKMALFYVYWGIRSLPEYAASDTHPSLSDRLYELCTKLAQVKEAPFVKSYTVGEDLTQQIARVPELAKFAINIERIYMSQNGIAESDALYIKWHNYIEKREHTRRARAWQKVSIWVEEASGTLADNSKDIFYNRKKAAKVKASLLKQQRKSQRSARRRSK